VCLCVCVKAWQGDIFWGVWATRWTQLHVLKILLLNLWLYMIYQVTHGSGLNRRKELLLGLWLVTGEFIAIMLVYLCGVYYLGQDGIEDLWLCSTTPGGSLDRAIDSEDTQHSDFLRLVRTSEISSFHTIEWCIHTPGLVNQSAQDFLKPFIFELVTYAQMWRKEKVAICEWFSFAGKFHSLYIRFEYPNQ
jgi:hypothetical protein